MQDHVIPSTDERAAVGQPGGTSGLPPADGTGSDLSPARRSAATTRPISPGALAAALRELRTRRRSARPHGPGRSR